MKNQRVKKVFRSRISVLLLGLVLAIFIPKIISTIKYMINSDSFTLGGILVFGAVMFLLSVNPNIKVNVPVKKGILRIWDWDI